MRPSQQASRGSIARDKLRRVIQREFRPGSRLPSEQELAKRLGVSRNTMREVLEELRASGLLFRKWGLGTFVNPNAALIQSSLSELQPIPAIIRENGYQCRMRDYAFRRYTGPAPIGEWLRLSPDVGIWELERVYLAGETPAIYVRDYVPERIGEVSVAPDKFKEDMLTFMQEQCGVPIDHTLTFLEPVLPDATVREKLAIPEGTPLLFTKQVAYSDGGDALLYTEGYQRTDVLSFHIVRRRRL